MFALSIYKTYSKDAKFRALSGSIFSLKQTSSPFAFPGPREGGGLYVANGDVPTEHGTIFSIPTPGQDIIFLQPAPVTGSILWNWLTDYLHNDYWNSI